MKKYALILAILSYLLMAEEQIKVESFITAQEYGKHLYENPRGIGCIKCHGKKGEGSIIAKYEHQGEKKVLKTDEIISISYEDFLKAMKKPKSVMPKYFLTQEEYQALYAYIQGEQY